MDDQLKTVKKESDSNELERNESVEIEQFVEEIENTEEVIVSEINETDEYLEEEDENNHYMKHIVIAMVAGAILLIALGLFLFYPFSFKIAGEWDSSNVSGLYLTVNGSEARFETAAEDTTGLQLFYIGQLHPDGVNAYRFSDIKVQVEVNKMVLSSEELAELRANKDQVYDIKKETKEILLLQYKQKKSDQLFTAYNKNKIATIKGSTIYLPFQENKLTINSQYLYQDLIHMN